jgi:transposase
VKAYQRRRKQAIELRKAGKPLREIAKRTQTPLETVKNWVENQESKEK